MKRTTIFLSIFLCIFFTNLKAQDFEWAGTYGGSGEDVIRAMHTDLDGNTYSTGYFTDTADFDVSPIQFNLTSMGFYDVFIVKNNSEGNNEWAVSIGGTLFDYGTGITTDTDGNVYITGFFDTPVDFDPGPDEFTIIPLMGGDVFIMKLDSEGNFVWAKSVGGDGYEESTAIAVTSTGTVIVLGYFYEPVDFNPGPEEYFITSAGGSDTFILKLDEDGNYISTNRYGGSENDLALSMAIANNDELYITGFFEGTSDFDPRDLEENNLTSSNEGSSAYVLHLNNLGEPLSVGATQNGNVEAFAITVDSENNSYITGRFSGTPNFNLNENAPSISFTSEESFNGFVMKIDFFGQVAWTKPIESDDAVFGYDIATNNDGDVFSTGYFAADTDFNPSPDDDFILTKESGNATDAYIFTLNTLGEFVAAQTFGGANFIDTHQIGVDALGNIYLSGQFEGTVDLDPDTDEELNATSVTK